MFAAGVDGWGQATKRCVRSLYVVAVLPVFDEAAGLSQRDEQVLVQALVSEPADEALGERVLCGLAWCDVVPVDLCVLRPFEDRTAGQFRAVVGDDHAGLATQRDDPVQFTGNTDTGQGQIRHDGQSLTGEVIHDTQGPEPAAVSERVGDEVQTPAFIRPGRHCYGPACPHRPLAPPSSLRPTLPHGRA